MTNYFNFAPLILLVSFLAGCQTSDSKYEADTARFEASLTQVSVSLPPRNPFSNFLHTTRRFLLHRGSDKRHDEFVQSSY